ARLRAGLGRVALALGVPGRVVELRRHARDATPSHRPRVGPADHGWVLPTRDGRPGPGPAGCTALPDGGPRVRRRGRPRAPRPGARACAPVPASSRAPRPRATPRRARA